MRRRFQFPTSPAFPLRLSSSPSHPTICPPPLAPPTTRSLHTLASLPQMQPSPRTPRSRPCTPTLTRTPSQRQPIQARALGLPHIVMEVSAPYLESYRDNIARLRTEYGITVLATGDILDVCSSFMPRAAEGTGVLLACPLWAIQRQLLLELVWAYQLQPLVTCVNVAKFLEPTPTPAPAAGGASAVAGGATGQGATDGQGAGNVEAAAPAAASCPAAAAGKIAAGVAGGQSVVSSGKAAGDGVGEVECGSSTGANGAQARAAGEEAEVAVKARGFPTVGEHGPEGLLGCVLDRSMMQQLLLPARELFGVDECGEMGEFHTMCMSGLLMRAGGGEVGEGSGQQLAGAAGRRGHLRLRTEAKREGDYAYLALQEVELVEA